MISYNTNMIKFMISCDIITIWYNRCSLILYNTIQYSTYLHASVCVALEMILLGSSICQRTAMPSVRMLKNTTEQTDWYWLCILVFYSLFTFRSVQPGWLLLFWKWQSTIFHFFRASWKHVAGSISSGVCLWQSPWAFSEVPYLVLN